MFSKRFEFSFKKKSKGNQKQIKFFNQGPNNKWQDCLKDEIKSEIETKLNTEMKELGYL